jgi:hypothetical protein
MSLDASPAWGTHSGALSLALESLPPGSLVVEHGAGIYSTPLIARYDVQVICIESLPGWASWANWVYLGAGRVVSTCERAKRAVPHLPRAALVFIDGLASERADLLKWSIAAKVPTIIAHDTERDASTLYGYAMHDVQGYTIAHDDRRPRTTVWQRLA